MKSEKKKKILIVFPNTWLNYSPTTLNVAKKLAKNYHVTIMHTGTYNQIQSDELSQQGIYLISQDAKPDFFWYFANLRHHLIRGLRKIGFLPPPDAQKVVKNITFYYYIKFLFFAFFQKKDLIIAIDNFGLWVAQNLHKKVIWLSLEVEKDAMYYKLYLQKVQALVIQSEERKEYLVGENSEFPVFYLQNAPAFVPNLQPKHKANQKLLYFGYIIPIHGIEEMIEALSQLEPCYSLTLKGHIFEKYENELLQKYQKLFESNRLILDKKYIADEEIAGYISGFACGFCLYNPDEQGAYSFNYESSPSGKLFHYYNAGIPVIASDILGLNSAKEFGCGVSVAHSTPEYIKNAIVQIEENHQQFSENARKAAQHYDFDANYQALNKYIYEQIGG